MSFNEYLATESVDLSVTNFVINIALTCLLTILVRFSYIKFGTSLSNRRDFSRIFVLMSVTTMIVITIVKSSLALSLGLVGALSIVRFRTAIKDPEELIYLFLCISIGLGFGADQRLITIVAVISVLAIILLSGYRKELVKPENMILILNSSTLGIDYDELTKVISNHCERVDLNRIDESKENVEVAFYIEIKDAESLNNLRNELKSICDVNNITIFDNKRGF